MHLVSFWYQVNTRQATDTDTDTDTDTFYLSLIYHQTSELWVF